MSKVAFLSDIHFGARGDSELFFNATKKFLRNVFFPTLIEKDITQVFLLGDIWDKRKIINISILRQVLGEFFDKLRDLNIQVYMIYGNHCVYYKNTNEVNSIDFLGKTYSNIQVIPTTAIVEVHGVKFGLVSWINPSNKTEKLRWIQSCKADMLLGHFEISNMHLPDGTEYTDGLDRSLFSRFEYVVSGHYHNRTFDGKIYYLGSPIEFTWGDYGMKKGLTLFDCSSRTFEFIENAETVHEKIVYDEKAINVLTFPYERYFEKIVAVFIPSFMKINTSQYNIFIESLGAQCYSLDIKELNSDFVDLNVSAEDSLGLTDTRVLIDSYVDTALSANANVVIDDLRTYVKGLYKAALNSDGNLA